MDTIEKVYCTGHDNNDALVAALASKNNCDPIAALDPVFRKQQVM